MSKLFLRIINIVVLLAAIAAVLPSCDRNDRAFPVIFEGDEHWSMVDGEGEIIARDAFASQPSEATDGIFRVRNSNGYFELYSIKSVQSPVSDREFCAVSDFFEGRAFATPRDGAISIIDSRGRDCLLLDSIAGVHPEELIPVGNGIGVFTAGGKYGAVNLRGEIVKPLSSRPLLSFYADSTGLGYTCRNNFIFRDRRSGRYGVRDAEGNTLIKPIFRQLTFIDADHLAAAPALNAPDGSQLYVILNIEGKQLSEGPFYSISPILGKYLFVETRPGRWRLMDLDGEYPDVLPPVNRVAWSEPKLAVAIRSDRVDIPAMLGKLGLTVNGVCGIGFSSSAGQIAVQAETLSADGRPLNPADFAVAKEINLFPRLDGETASVTASFPSEVSHPTYTTRRVEDKIWGIFPTTRTETVATGFEFVQLRPFWLTLRINNYGRLRGKLPQVQKAVTDLFIRGGAGQTESNSGATLLSLPSGRSAVVAVTPHAVVVNWGLLPDSEKQISRYADSREDTKINEQQ